NLKSVRHFNLSTHYIKTRLSVPSLFPEQTNTHGPTGANSYCVGSRSEFSAPEQVIIKRQLYTQHSLNQKYEDQAKPTTLCDLVRKECRCSGKCFARHALYFVPVAKSLKRYKWRQWAVADLVAGLSVGFIHLPQGLGFGILASLTPAVGLYTSFFPILVYLIFGTSPHVSMGTNALIALLTGAVVDREVLALGNGTRFNMTDSQVMEFKVGVSAAMCFIGGVVLLAMGLLRLGFITNFLSRSFIGGFTFAAAVHIVTSQVVKMLHLKIPNASGFGALVLTYINIFKNIADSNVADLIVGLICMAVLLAVKIGINERYKDKLKVPVPIELIVVILSTLISHFAKLHDRFGVGVVGDVPTGLPAPSLPPMDVLPRVASDALEIALLCFALTISLGKMCGKLHGTKMDDNQELVAYGMCHLVGCFFQNFPPCVAPPRTMMLSSLGAKSTLNGVSSAVFILLVLLVAGQLFVSLPIAMLAAMIIVAMKDLLLQARQLRSLWHINKPDLYIWVLTAVVGIFADLGIGLLVGMVFSMVTVLGVSQLASGTLLGRAEDEDVVMDAGCRGIKPIPGVRIFRFETTLYYASADRFRNQLFSLVFDPTKATPRPVVLAKVDADSAALESSEPTCPAPSDSHPIKTDASSRNDVRHVILDCSSMTYIDVAGIDTLLLTYRQFSQAGVIVLLAAVPSATLATLNRANFFDVCSEDKVFYTVFDALQNLSDTPSLWDCVRVRSGHLLAQAVLVVCDAKGLRYGQTELDTVHSFGDSLDMEEQSADVDQGLL
ncbi:hypothetical protein BaRGS_00008341, partial [Batillaria attramentaria]